MPNRILRPWTDSEAINLLSDAAEVFFVRLIMCADDFGRFYGDPRLLKSYLYPLRDKRIDEIESMISECVNSGLISEYEFCGKHYLEILNFRQQTRTRKSRFPKPLKKCYADDMQMHSNCIANATPETRDVVRETETNIFMLSDDKSSSNITPEPENSGSPGSSKSVKIFFDYDGDAKIHGIDQKQLDRWKEDFPALDVESELRTMSAWLDANRMLRKKNVKRFIVNWLSKTQERAHIIPAKTQKFVSREKSDNGKWEV